MLVEFLLVAPGIIYSVWAWIIQPGPLSLSQSPEDILKLCIVTFMVIDDDCDSSTSATSGADY